MARGGVPRPRKITAMNILQVVGGPGSGKTTLVRQLLQDWPGTASLLRVDRYLRDRAPEDGDDFWLLPTSIDWSLLQTHLLLLEAGLNVTMPRYDWAAGRRRTLPVNPPPEQIVTACQWLIIEGLFYVPGIESVRLFVDAPAEVRRARAQARDTMLSQSLGSAYDAVAEPAYLQYILPQRALADYVLDGTLEPARLADAARRALASRWAGWG